MKYFWVGFEKRAVQYNASDLRSSIGVAAVIRDDKNRILMLKHNKFGFWTIPVGKGDPGESAPQALSRELGEEVGVKVNNSDLMARQKYVYRREGIDVTADIHLYDIKSFSGQPKNKEPLKHAEMKYMSLDEIKKLTNISDVTKLMLSRIGK